MHRRTRRRAGQQPAEQHAAMLRHEHVVQTQRTTAGAGKPEYMPVVDDLDVGERHKEIADAGWITLPAEKGADDRPARVGTAA